MSFDPNTMEFSVKSNVALQTIPENFKVTVILQDEFGAFTKNKFTVKLLPDVVEALAKKGTQEKDIIRNESTTQNVEPKDFVKDAPPTDGVEKIISDTGLVQNSAIGPKPPGLTAKISKVAMDGSF